MIGFCNFATVKKKHMEEIEKFLTVFNQSFQKNLYTRTWAIPG